MLSVSGLAAPAGTWYTTCTPITAIFDGLGSTSLATKSNGQELTGSRTLYYPYGQVRWSDGTLPTDYTFTGQRDAGLGLMDYRARFYDPFLGRFVSVDTIVPNPQNPQDLNRYSYVRNSPLNYRDPSGHYLEMGDGLGLREIGDGTYRVLHGGSVFVNDVEVALANYALSGGESALPETGGAFGSTIEGSINHTRAGLGHTDGGSGVWSSWADPIALAGMTFAMVKAARRSEIVPSESIPSESIPSGPHKTYVVRNESEQIIYVGRTKQTLSKRQYQHRRTDGRENWVLELDVDGMTKDQVHGREQILYDTYVNTDLLENIKRPLGLRNSRYNEIYNAGLRVKP